MAFQPVDASQANYLGGYAEDELPPEENEGGGETADSAGDPDAEEKKCGYNYLLAMPLWSLTLEKVEELRRQLKQKEEELDKLLRTSIQEIWGLDLDAIQAGLDERDRLEEEERVRVHDLLRHSPQKHDLLLLLLLTMR